jgi:hypothetical protein
MKMFDGKNTKLTVHTGVLNVFSLGALSFTWAHFLGLISLWFIPVTILMYMIGYGSEIKSIIDMK